MNRSLFYMQKCRAKFDKVCSHIIKYMQKMNIENLIQWLCIIKNYVKEKHYHEKCLLLIQGVNEETG